MSSKLLIFLAFLAFSGPLESSAAHAPLFAYSRDMGAFLIKRPSLPMENQPNGHLRFVHPRMRSNPIYQAQEEEVEELKSLTVQEPIIEITCPENFVLWEDRCLPKRSEEVGRHYVDMYINQWA